MDTIVAGVGLRVVVLAVLDREWDLLVAERGATPEARRVLAVGAYRAVLHYVVPDVYDEARFVSLSHGSVWEDDTIVFPTFRGGVMAGRNLSRRYLKPILKRAGLSEATRLYDLRHTFATILSDSGEATEVISKLHRPRQTEYDKRLLQPPNDRARREAMGHFGGLWE